MGGMGQDTCVTGEEWLLNTFDAALRTSQPPYEELRTELRALSESRLLSDEEALRARVRLEEDERDKHMQARRRAERKPYVNGVSCGRPARKRAFRFTAVSPYCSN